MVRVRQMVQEEVRGGQPQVTDRDVQGAIALFSNLARRVGAVPSGVSLPPAIRSQRWSPWRRPICADCGVVGVQFHGEQAFCGNSLRTDWAALRSVMRSVMRSWGVQFSRSVDPVVEESRFPGNSSWTPHLRRIFVP